VIICWLDNSMNDVSILIERIRMFRQHRRAD